MNFQLSLLAICLGFLISILFSLSVTKILKRFLKIPQEIAVKEGEAYWDGTGQDLKFSLFIKNLSDIGRWVSLSSLCFLLIFKASPSMIFLWLAFARPVVSICLIGLALQSCWLFTKIVNLHSRD